MTISKDRRLERIKHRMTPKEWAIKQADELRQAPDLNAAVRKYILRREDMSDVFQKMAEEEHPGRQPEDIRVQNRLKAQYWIDWKTRINLMKDLQTTIIRRVEVAGLEAALKLQTLQTAILQDSFSRTARKAAEWIEEYRAADPDEEENRQIMLKELEAYMDIRLEGDEGPRSLDLGRIRISFPSRIQLWIDSIKALINDVLKHQAAVRLIQDSFFDGHPILALDVEAVLKATVQKIEDIVSLHNEYLDVRRTLFGDEWEEDDAAGLNAGLAGEVSGQLIIDIDQLKPPKKAVSSLANEWIKLAKADAVADVKDISEGPRAAAQFLAQELLDGGKDADR